jgi:cytochrome c biogenesis protein CcmG/thiol:disulfide interchange protein DsbE
MMSADVGDSPEPTRSSGRRKLLAFLPLIAFAVLAGIFLSRLMSDQDASVIPSALIGTAAPSLDMPPLEGLMRDGQPVPALSNAQVKDKVTIVNVWASWCLPCRQEHPLLMALAEDERINLVGVNYKDQTPNALRFLGELGNPYAAVGVDPKGVAAIDWGVYGIPETYLLGRDGTILYKQVGPFSPGSIRNNLLPEIEKALSVPQGSS